MATTAKYFITDLKLGGPFSMAVTMSGRTIRPGCFTATGTRSPIVFSKRALKLQHTEINGPRELMFRKGKVQSKPLSQVALATDSADISINTPATSNSIMQFYKSINDKKLKQLEQLLSDDCFFDDYSFPKPFEGKQEVIKFLEQLITSMGHHTEFSVEHICEGDDLTAAVNWHLDWKKKQVPFTRGSSYFGFARDGETLVIKKVQAVIESPIKPGGLALGLFKIITSLFDAFPGAAERFLKSPHVIFTLLLKIYNIILQPILSPLIAWYLKLWSFTVGIISITLKILQYIAKIISS